MINKIEYKEIIEYLKDDTKILEDLVMDCFDYDGSLEDYNYYENDTDFFDTFFHDNTLEAVRATCYGDYNYCDDYVKFDGYGNLESCNKFEFKELLKNNAKEIFDTWLELYKDNNVDSYYNNFKELVDQYIEEENSNE